jgi:polysaccharide biosynthesis/export protein
MHLKPPSRFVRCALACALPPWAALLHAQGAMPAPQFGSTTGGGGGSASAAAAALKTGSTGIIAVPEDFAKLKIQPGFQIQAQVFDEPDLSGQFRVGSDGNIVMPLIGPVHVAGKTLREAEQTVQDAFKSAQILKNPQITLDITQYAPTLVTVLGEVISPGRLQMLAPHSLLDVISFAGGETQLAGGKVEVRHEENGEVTTSTYHYERDSNGDSIANVMVHDGDMIIVPRAGIVYVLGQVTRPGGFLMEEDGKLDAAQAISMAMGTTLLASTKHILIIRRNPDGTFVQFEINYNDMVRGKVTPPQLQPQDIVYVPNSKIKTALSDTQSVLSAAATAAIYRGAD